MGFIKLEWEVPKKGFKLEEYVLPRKGSALLSGSRTGTYLVPRGSETRSYSIDLLEESVFLKLANTPPEPDDVLAFVNQWGLPTRGEWTITDFNRLARHLGWSALKANENGISALAKDYLPGARNGSIRWGFRSVRQAAPSICFLANDLRTFCWLELLQAFAGPTDIGQCPICKTLLQRPKAGPLPQYCSQRCIQQAYRNRTKAGAATAQKPTKRARA